MYYSSCTCFIFFLCRVIPCLPVLSTLQSSIITQNFRNAAMFINTDFQICVSESMIFKSNFAVLNSSTIVHPPASLFYYFLLAENHHLVYPEDGGSRFIPVWQISTTTHGATSQKLFTIAANINPHIILPNAVTPFQTGKPTMIHFLMLQTDTFITLQFMTEKV